MFHALEKARVLNDDFQSNIISRHPWWLMQLCIFCQYKKSVFQDLVKTSVLNDDFSRQYNI